MRVVDAMLSATAALRASAALGRATRMQTRGDLKSAMVEARRGLGLLAASYVRRHNAPEGSALASLTVLVENVGSSLRDTGASSGDLRDSIEFLKRLPEESTAELRAHLPFLEMCLAARSDRIDA